MAKKQSKKAKVVPSCNGGDALARGGRGTSATFPSCSHVEQKRFDIAILNEQEFVEKHGKRAYKRAVNGDFN